MNILRLSLAFLKDFVFFYLLKFHRHIMGYTLCQINVLQLISNS